VLDEAVELARAMCGSTVTGDLVEIGPAAGLLGSVRDGDLLVLGSRGRGALRAGIFGSTVNSILDAAAIPVAVFRDDAIR
jgi:nucleotide-binding universal stress UspA family protein